MKTVALRDIVDFHSGGTPAKANPAFWNGQTPWFSAKDVKRPRLCDSADHVSDAALGATSLRKLPAGTVLMVVRGMILAHTVPIAILDIDAAINQDLKALLPRQEIDATFLAAMLRAQHSEILAQVSTAAHGTKKLDSRVLEEIRIPLPSLDEQRRIAEILDHADALRAKRRQVLDHLDALTQSIFDDTFAQSAGRRMPLGHIASVTSGITKGRRTLDETYSVPYLAVVNVQAGHLRLDPVKTIEATALEIERFRLSAGDLVLTEGGDPDKLGRGTLWRGELPLCLHQNHVFRVRINQPTIIRPEYLAQFMSSRPARAYFQRAAKQTTGIASINMTQLKALPVDIPDIASQDSFFERKNRVAAQRAASRAALARKDELFASLQSRAFRGEL